jgi:hypothetical protein
LDEEPHECDDFLQRRFPAGELLSGSDRLTRAGMIAVTIMRLDYVLDLELV